MMNTSECHPPVGQIERSKKTSFHMERLLKPLLVCMSVFGLYSSNRQPSGRKCPGGPLKIYSVFVFIILCGGGIYNSAITYDKELTAANKGPLLGIWVLNVVFYSLNVITALVLFVSCCRKDGLPALVKSWIFLQQTDGHSSNNRAITKAVCGSLLVVLIYVALSSVNFVISFVKKGYFSFNAEGIIMIIWHGVMETYHTGVWCLSNTLVFVLSFVICTEFKSFEKDFRCQISSDGKFMGDLREFRRRHQLICSQVEKMDDVVSIIVGCGVFINTIQVLLGLYVIVWHPAVPNDANMKLLTGQWLLASVGIVIIVYTSGAFINHMAHASLSDAYRIDIMDSKEMVTELQIFLSRLNGKNIGLTVMKLFVVDKSTILTVCGLLITYYLVLEQFQSADNSCCTNRLNITCGT